MQQIGIAAFPGQRQGPVVNKPFSVLLTWQILAYCGDFRNSRGAPERSAPEQARLNADQQRMALMHADWPQAATAGRGSYRKLSLAALPRHPRSIRVHLRHLLLICVESYLPWRATHDCAGARHSTPRAQAR
jgi:hypothetical protein